ncbi:MAG: ATP-binding cassette domain-containing protein [Rhodocyclaceae bacterium]
MPEDRTDLTLDDLSIGLLTGVSLTIAAGETVCLSGPSGSGKSRLLRAVADLDAHTGRVALGQLEQRAASGHGWRAQVMMVPAESQWWFDTVGEHFAGVPDEGLAALGFDADALSWQVSRLSSGEKQRLSLLRAVARNPRALLLDEPTANLDADTTLRTERWLKHLAVDRGLPLLWVAHDTGQIHRVADRHYRIAGSRLERVA